MEDQRRTVGIKPVGLRDNYVHKTKLYNDLLGRQQIASEAGFYFESCWFAHAIFEDRTRSIVSNSGDGKGYGGKISEKLTLILQRWDEEKTKTVADKPVKDKRTGNKIKVPKWPALHTIERRLVSEIQLWTQDRNHLVHGLASGNLSLAEADVLSQRLSELGLDLTREICSAARRLKKRSNIA